LKDYHIASLDELPEELNSWDRVYYKRWGLGVGEVCNDPKVRKAVSRAMKNSFYVTELNYEEGLKE
jgi:hypothetical protein